jgi:ubiquinone/menaquinone biosynthesis C-methylase UbiE
MLLLCQCQTPLWMSLLRIVCLISLNPDDLSKALKEAFRVLKPGGRLQMSDPIATRAIPAHLQQDEQLRAMCLSGALTYEQYIQRIVDAGFGQVEIRTRRPLPTS